MPLTGDNMRGRVDRRINIGFSSRHNNGFEIQNIRSCTRDKIRMTMIDCRCCALERRRYCEPPCVIHHQPVAVNRVNAPGAGSTAGRASRSIRGFTPAEACRLGGAAPCASTRMVLIRPDMPAAPSRCLLEAEPKIAVVCSCCLSVLVRET